MKNLSLVERFFVAFFLESKGGAKLVTILASQVRRNLYLRFTEGIPDYNIHMDLKLNSDGKIYIWLDDQWKEPGMPDRWPPEGWMGVIDGEEFREVVDDAISRNIKLGGLNFDNSLGEGKEEGYKLAEWIVSEHPEWFLGDEILLAHTTDVNRRPYIEGSFRDIQTHKDLIIEAKAEREKINR